MSKIREAFGYALEMASGNPLDGRMRVMREAIDNALYRLNPSQGEPPDPTGAQMWLRTALPRDHPNYLSREYVEKHAGLSISRARAHARR